MSVSPTIWRLAASCAAPFLQAGLRRRARRGKEIPGRLTERLGIEDGPRPSGRLLWIHAASVGESVSILPVLTVLSEQAPELGVLLTTGTVTSARLLAERLPALGLARVLHRFAPLDVPRWAGRFLDHWHPDAAVFVESELWPNLLDGCQARGIPAMLLNARLSPRSARHWRLAPRAARRILGGFRAIRAQSHADAERLRCLGAACVSAPGNLKFAAPALPADERQLNALRAALGGRPRWVAASTHPGEEAIVLASHTLLAASHADLLTIIVPRHPERGAALAALTGAPRRSQGAGPPANGVWIADTMGELGLWYRLADAALVGRSLLAPGGGQNPLEAARLGCPVAAGPFMDNFADAARTLEAAGAIARVTDAATLATWLGGMIDHPERRSESAAAGRAAVSGYETLADETAVALLDLLGHG